MDQPVHRLNPKQRSELHKKHVGFVFQSYHLLDNLTVYENLEIPLSYRNVSRKDRQSMVADILDRFQIVGKKDLYPNQLSGGQQQLVGVARAVIANPQVILADEPTGNLHSAQGKEIMELFRRTERRRHDDHPGHALGSERVVRHADHSTARRLGGRRLRFKPKPASDASKTAAVRQSALSVSSRRVAATAGRNSRGTCPSMARIDDRSRRRIPDAR